MGERSYPVPVVHQGALLGAAATLDRLDLAAAMGNEWAAKVVAKENQRTVAEVCGDDPRLPYGVLDGDEIVGLYRDGKRWTRHGWEPCSPPTGAEVTVLPADDVAFIARAQVEGSPVRLLPYTPLAVLRAAVDFNPLLHPRDFIGRFIEVGGRVKFVGGRDKNKRGTVTAIEPTSDPNEPWVLVRMDDGTERRSVPRELVEAPEKATLRHRISNAVRQQVAEVRAPDDQGLLVNPRGLDLSPEEVQREGRNIARLGVEQQHEGAQARRESVARRRAAEAEFGPAPGTPETPAQFEAEAEADEKLVNTTLTPEQAREIANKVEDGQPVPPPPFEPEDLDDIILDFADSDKPVDLTLLSEFSAMRGNGVPRAQMPQIPVDRLKDFQNRLRNRGFQFGPDEVDPTTLQATQSELDGKSVGGMITATRNGKLDLVSDPLWISNDNHVLDGHHRWATASAISANCGGCLRIPVIRVDMPMSQLLAFANDFNNEAGVQRQAFGQVTQFQPSAPAAPAAVAAGPPQPDADGYFTMATDEADGITEEDLVGLPEGDGSAFTEEEPPSRTAALRAAAGDLPEGTKVIAVVDDMDRNAVLDTVAVLPGPKIMRRHDGKWVADQGWLSVLRSVRPPPVVVLTDDQIPDVLSQIDESTKGSPFEPTKPGQRMAASAMLARADEMLIEWAIVAGLKPVVAVAGMGRMDPDLARYWRYGEGAAKIRWGTPGAMTRCAHHLVKYVGPGRAYQTCNNLSKPLGGKGVAWDVD